MAYAMPAHFSGASFFGFRIAFRHIVTSAMNPQHIKRSSMPFHMICKDAINSVVLISIVNSFYPAKYGMTKLKTMPLAATEATWPDTLALTACISRMFSGSSLSAIF